MHNLVSLQRRVWSLQTSSTSDDHCVASTSIPGDEHLFFLHSSGLIESLHLDEQDMHAHGKDLEIVFDLQKCVEDNGVSTNHWKWMKYVAELEALVCASTTGALVAVDVDSMIGKEVGNVDSGLRAIAWSANQEVLALVTGANSLLVMSNDWETLHETAIIDSLPSDLTLCTTEQDEKNWYCDLCWRSDAAYIALNIATRTRDNNVVHKVMIFTKLLEFQALGRLEDGRAVSELGSPLHWSQSLALIASCEVRKKRLVVVFFERNGLRHGEFVIPAAYDASEYQVASVQWNTKSDVLAVTLQEKEHDKNEHFIIQLWSRNNYHWYLKQELHFQNRLIDLVWDEDVAGRFHVLTCSSYTQALTLYEHEYAWDICSIESDNPSLKLDYLSMERKSCDVAKPRQSVAVTGVIDGSMLLLTPLHRALVPPPFALLQLTLDAAINSVVFDSQAEVLLVLLANGDVILVENFLAADASSSSAGLPVSQRSAVGSISPDVLMKKTAIKLSSMVDDKPCTFTCLLWVRFENLTRQLVFAGKTGWRDQLMLCLASNVSLETNEVVTAHPIQLYDVRRACLIQPMLVKNDRESEKLSIELAIQTHSGTMYTLDAMSKTLMPGQRRTKLPTFSCITVLDCHDQSMPREKDEYGYVVIGLNGSSARLYVNDKVIAFACSSFRYCARSSMLLYTLQGRESQLCIAPLSGILDFAYGNITKVKFEARSVERGALLVATLSQQSSVIVQMPRGNLESVFPRVLVLALVVHQIQNREYVAALETCRRHRLDINVLVDLNPAEFLTNFSQSLVQSLLSTRPATVTSDRLCLFITNLHPVDVWATKYGPQLEAFNVARLSDDHPNGAALSPEKKVNTVCQEVMRVSEKLASDGEQAEAALLLPFVTSAVKQTPPCFDKALGKIQQLLQKSDTNDQSVSARNRAAATRAVKHLIMLTNEETLYSEALGLYDLDLVRIVAMHSQLDPKEYSPFLNRVTSQTNEYWRKYTIDVHLGRHARALTHVAALISESSPDDQAARSKLQSIALDLIKEGELYNDALQLFPLAPLKAVTALSDRAFCQQILSLKGDFLLGKKDYEAAAYVYLSASDKDKARRAFIAARNWQMALALSARDQQSTDKLREEAYALAQELLNQTQHRQDGTVDDIVAVSRIYVEYCNDIDEAVALLVTHQQWSEALRIAYLHRRNDLVESDVEPGLLHSCNEVMEEIERKETQYTKHFKRLTDIREQKRLFKLHGIDGTRWDHVDTDAGSIHSGASSAVDSALSYTSVSSVGSHNSAASIGNFSMQSLSMATASHFYATQSLRDASKNAKHNGRYSRRERRKRMKEGSAEEEAYVEQQLLELRPNASLAREIRGLLEMLLLFNRVQEAQKLQSQFAQFEQCVEQMGRLSLSEKSTTACVIQLPQWRSEALHD
ncbi:elongator complex protein 1 [Plasmopara halstedii]|uniref:Elongator complex protein 1 n=1 Tax=Plasmopara halstedii TaxID=4781 RepID=A0A0N7L4V4_PLAHL|nr:elongator complex protein 1 [Plasmopara halstedii]CEG39723.1 elongator complex protein 1 [Plasmopara halstedii]|eukprot:XP_024576092.1 elongator complex protein 1 [Plasmopara halstedii]